MSRPFLASALALSLILPLTRETVGSDITKSCFQRIWLTRSGLPIT